jgi:UTP--glucose-1-phosphate uridylyltransferase
MTQPIAAIKTVIIPAAGKGTRMRPATQVTPKELLPIYDRLVIQFAIDEAIEAGAERIIVVVSPEKPAIREFLGDRASTSTRGSGRMHRDGSAPEIVYVCQDEPMGLGHAVLRCQGQTLQGQFGVILPDDIIMDGSCLSEMAGLHEQGHMIAATKVPLQDTTKYGIFSLLGPASGSCIPASGIVEKPARGRAPSTIAAVGRYILQPMIFDILAHTPKGAGGEVQLTDAIAVATRVLPLTAFRFSGTRYDCGNHDGLLAASNARQAAVESDRRIAPLSIAGNRPRPTEAMPSMVHIAGG